MPVIDYQAYRHLPRVITGPGVYRTTRGRTVTITQRYNLKLDYEEWWNGNYDDDPRLAADGPDYRIWTYHGVRFDEHDTDRLLPARPALAYIRSCR